MSQLPKVFSQATFSALGWEPMRETSAALLTALKGPPRKDLFQTPLDLTENFIRVAGGIGRDRVLRRVPSFEKSPFLVKLLDPALDVLSGVVGPPAFSQTFPHDCVRGLEHQDDRRLELVFRDELLQIFRLRLAGRIAVEDKTARCVMTRDARAD